MGDDAGSESRQVASARYPSCRGASHGAAPDACMLCQKNYTLHINVTKDQKVLCNGHLSDPEAETSSPTFRSPPHTSGPARAASSQHHCAQLSHNLNARPSYLMELARKIARGTRGGGIHCFSKQELKFHPQQYCIKYTLKLVNFWY